MKDLHLLVPCTAKKSKSVPNSMNLHPLRDQTLEGTRDNWVSAFKSSQERLPAKSLYTGQAFKSLSTASEEYDLNLHILSAGFGLISGDQMLPGYNATFAANTHRVPTPHTQWWQALSQSDLPGKSIFEFFGSHPDGKFIFCLGNEYLKAVENDLKAALDAMTSPKNRIVLITSSIPKPLKEYDFLFINCSEKVLHHKESEGIAKDNGLAIARRNITTIATHLFLHRLKGTNASFSDIISALNKEFEKIPTPKKVTRVKRDDDFVIDFIKKDLEENGATAIAKALKRYQAAGYACLDSRFRDLYKATRDLYNATKDKGSM